MGRRGRRAFSDLVSEEKKSPDVQREEGRPSISRGRGRKEKSRVATDGSPSGYLLEEREPLQKKRGGGTREEP